jgi:hypothetical protein
MKVIIDIPEQIYNMVMNTGTYGVYRFNSTKAIKKGKPLPTLTDPEQRLFLSAISREEKLCKRIDEDKVPDGNVRMLVPLCQNIERKVKEVLF